MGGKINILNANIHILCSTNFKLVSQINGNSISNCDPC